MDQGFRVFRRTRRKDDDLKIDDLDKKVESLFGSQDLLFERLHTEPKWQKTKKVYEHASRHAKTAARTIHKQPVMAKVAIVIALSMTSGIAYWSATHRIGVKKDGGSAAVNEVASANDSQQEGSEGAQTAQPSFAVLVPTGKNLDDLGGMERKSPSGDTVYTYADNVEGIRVEITQQQLPESFKSDPAGKVKELAKSFYAESVIQVDDTSVYHGYSDKTRYQTLIFTKKDKLIFILSPTKISDDKWAGYLVGLD